MRIIIGENKVHLIDIKAWKYIFSQSGTLDFKSFLGDHAHRPLEEQENDQRYLPPFVLANRTLGAQRQNCAPGIIFRSGAPDTVSRIVTLK